MGDNRCEKMELKTSVLIYANENKDELMQCISGIRSSLAGQYEIIVIDNSCGVDGLCREQRVGSVNRFV